MTEKLYAPKKVFIAYVDDNGNNIEGYCLLLEQTESYIKFKTDQNIIIIPYSRLLKIKESLK